MAGDELVCCERCGRDTTNKCRLCSRCLSGKPTYLTHCGEHRGRKVRQATATNDDEPDEETSRSRYHGDNYEE